MLMVCLSDFSERMGHSLYGFDGRIPGLPLSRVVPMDVITGLLQFQAVESNSYQTKQHNGSY